MTDPVLVALYLLTLALVWVLLAWDATRRGARWSQAIYLIGAMACLWSAFRLVQAAGHVGGP